MRDPTMLFTNSPARATGPADDSVASSSLLHEISTLRMRLKDLEDDTKSSVVSGGLDDQDLQLSNMLRKDIATLEQEKATLEKDFLNQLASLATENQKRICDMQTKLAESEALHFELNEKLLRSKDKSSDGVDEEKEHLVRMLEELREAHSREIDQMKQNLASTDMEITESRGEIDQLHEQLEELQTHRETLIEEVTACKMDLTEEQRKLVTVKSEFSKTKLTVEKLQKELKAKDEKLESKNVEIDKLKKMVDDLKGSKKEIEEANGKITRLEKDVEEKLKLIERAKDEIGEMNDKIIDLQDHKEMLVTEVTDLRMELQKKEEKRNDSGERLSINTAVTEESEGSADDRPITPLEKQKLEEDLNRLADRLAGFQVKLNEKDSHIESLSSSLVEERRLNKKLKVELKSCISKNATSVRTNETASHPTTPTAELRSSETRHDAKHTVSPALRQIDTSLSDFDDHSFASPRQDNLYGTGRRPPPSIATKNMSPMALSNNPRTPVSGLVASFEKRIKGQREQPVVATSEEDNECPIPSLETALDYADFKQELEAEKSLTRELEQQLQNERSAVSHLKALLAKEKDSLQTSSADLEAKLQHSQREVRKLKSKLGKLEEAKQKTDEELSKVQSQTVYMDVEREDLENKIKCHEHEIIRLRLQLETASQYPNFSEEKKEDQTSEEVRMLESLLKEKDESLQHLKEQLKKEEDLNEQNHVRLRSLLSKKEQEHKEVLEVLLKDVAEKDNEIETLQNEIAKFYEEEKICTSELRVEVDALQTTLTEREEKIKHLEAELVAITTHPTNVDMSKEIELQTCREQLNQLEEEHKKMEIENSKLIQDLESKITSLELSAADESVQRENLRTALEAAEKRIDSSPTQINVDEERESLTYELAKVQMSRAELEMEHAKRIKEMEGMIKNLEAKLKFEMEEKQNLHQTISEITEKSEKEVAPSLQKVHDSEINRITVELTKTQIKQADLEREYSTRIRDLEMEIEDLESEAEEELRQKDKEIDELRRALELKEEEMNRLELERSRLCTSMNDMSFSRKDEIHELQADIIDLSTKTKAQEREIQTLKLRIQDYENQNDDSTMNSRQKMKDLENEITELKSKIRNQLDPDTVSAVKAENAKLRESVRELKLERRALNERLEALMSERNGSKSSQILQKRNVALKDEVEKLTKRLKKLEASITRFAI